MPWSPQNAVVAASLVTQGSLTSSSGITVPVSGSTTLMPLQDISSYGAYDISIYSYVTSRASGAPNAYSLKLLWYDDMVSGIPVFQEEWWPWCGLNTSTNLSAAALGTGPMHGRYMSVVATNPSATQVINIQYVNIYGSPRAVPYSDWRQNAQPNSPSDPVFVDPGIIPGDTIDNTLMYLDATMAINLSWLIPIGLYSGPVQIYFSAQQSFSANPSLFSTAGGAISGNLTTSTPELFQWVVGPSKEVQSVLMPRGGGYILLSTGSTAVPFILSAVAQQAA